MYGQNLEERESNGPEGLRSLDLTLRKRSHYPSYATGPIERNVKFLKTFGR